MEGNCVPDAVCNVMEQNGFSVSRKKPSGVGTYTHRSWDYVITPVSYTHLNLNFFKKGDYPYKLCTFAPPSVNY